MHTILWAFHPTDCVQCVLFARCMSDRLNPENIKKSLTLRKIVSGFTQSKSGTNSNTNQWTRKTEEQIKHRALTEHRIIPGAPRRIMNFCHRRCITVRIPERLYVVAFWSWNLNVVFFQSWNLDVASFCSLKKCLGITIS